MNSGLNLGAVAHHRQGAAEHYVPQRERRDGAIANASTPRLPPPKAAALRIYCGGSSWVGLRGLGFRAGCLNEFFKPVVAGGLGGEAGARPGMGETEGNGVQGDRPMTEECAASAAACLNDAQSGGGEPAGLGQESKADHDDAAEQGGLPWALGDGEGRERSR